MFSFYRYLPFVALLLFQQMVMAQDTANTGHFRFFSLKFHTGKHHYTGSALSEKLKNGYGALEVRMGWQAAGRQAWQREHNNPSYGIGYYTGYVGDVDVFGNPHALFGFATFPFTHRHRNNFQVESSLGITYNLKPYDPNNNAINDAIGSKLAVYFSLHLGGKYRINRELDLLYGYDLTHFSNGRTVTPNLGLNMMGFSTGVRYNFNGLQRKTDNSDRPEVLLPARPVFGSAEKPARESGNFLSVYQAFGTVQNKKDAGTHHRYLVSSSVLEFRHQFNSKHAAVFGVDALLDPSARDTSEYKLNTDCEQFFPAIHLGYAFQCWRLSLELQVGTHLTKAGRELKGNYFIRPALRYRVNSRLFAQIGLKTMNGATADWVETGLGYHLIRRFRNQH